MELGLSEGPSDGFADSVGDIDGVTGKPVELEDGRLVFVDSVGIIDDVGGKLVKVESGRLVGDKVDG